MKDRKGGESVIFFVLLIEHKPANLYYNTFIK